MDFSGPDGTLSLRAGPAVPGADPAGCLFSGEAVEALMDMRWHKVALSVQRDSASLLVDCNPVETKPLEPRGVTPTDGHTLLGIRASDARSAQVCSTAISLIFVEALNLSRPEVFIDL